MELTYGTPGPQPDWTDADQDAKLIAMAHQTKRQADEEAAELFRVAQRLERLRVKLDDPALKGHPRYNEKAARYDLLCARRFHLVIALHDRQHRLAGITARMRPAVRDALGFRPDDVWPAERVVPAWVLRRAAERANAPRTHPTAHHDANERTKAR